MHRRHLALTFALASLLATTPACRRGDAAAEGSPAASRPGREGAAAERSNGRRPGGGGPPGGGAPGGGAPGGGRWGGGEAGGPPQAAVPVEVTAVVRRDISAFLETNSTLDAESDVDLPARTSGPIVELLVEEGTRVGEGQLLARLDAQEVRARLEISRVNLGETQVAFERAKKLFDSELLSLEAFETARSNFEAAQAQVRGDEIVLAYTEIRAPFAGVVSARYIKLAQTVSVNQRLFRITAFDPLLAPIQVPERQLPRLAVGQQAHLTVEAWPEERFPARVLRISPIVDAATGTVKVTLEVGARGKLRPGMFAAVFLETETRSQALVIPKAALSLESIGDTVYVAGAGVAERREVELGFHEGDDVEIVAGLAEGERLIVVGQDGLSDGTPIQVLDAAAAAPAAAEASEGPVRAGPDPARGPSPGSDGRRRPRGP